MIEVMRRFWGCSLPNLGLFLINVVLLLIQLSRVQHVQQPCPKQIKDAVPATPSHVDDVGPIRKDSANWFPFLRWRKNWDGMQALSEQWDRTGVKRHSRRLYLIRHGQYWGSGPNKTHLSPIGMDQAKLTGQRLKEAGTHFHSLTSSSSQRAKETSDIIQPYLSHLTVQYSDLLKEGWPTFPEPADAMFDPSHEAFKTEGARLDEAFRTFIHRADNQQKDATNEIIVAHGNVIAYFVLRSLQVPPERWLRLSVYQGSISILDVWPSGDVTVKVVGDVAHIPIKNWTG